MILVTFLFVLLPALLLNGCAEKEVPYDTNLLQNSSFEKVGQDGIPEGWQISLFKGLQGEEEAQYAVDNTVAQDGSNSFSFTGDYVTRRWYTLSQEIEVKDVKRVRLSGWMKLDQVELHPSQYAQCNLFLTYFDENHTRFQEMRRGDKRTRPRQGTRLWYEESVEFRVPEGTRYIEVGCILGMEGKVWFDNLFLSVPQPLEWETRETENYVYHWMPGSPPPEGAIVNQQRVFDYYEERLGVKSDVVIKYYLYPDTATIREKLGLKGHQYQSWPDREFHSINPNDDHEVVHFITDPYGVPPRAIAEGTVFWLQGNWMGEPIEKVAANLLANGQLASLSDLTTYNYFHVLDPEISLPTISAFVAFIAGRFGSKKLMELYTATNGLNSYQSFAPVFEAVYGVSAEEAEEAFRVALSGVDLSEGDEQQSE
jgi:hypothetical protein